MAIKGEVEWIQQTRGEIYDVLHRMSIVSMFATFFLSLLHRIPGLFLNRRGSIPAARTFLFRRLILDDGFSG